MPIYEYKGLNAKGKATSGIKDADSPRSLKERLKRDGVFLTQFTETARSGKVRQVGGEQAGSREVRFQLFSSVKSIEIAEFTRQMATLMRSGIPMLDSINAIVDQTENPKFKRILSQVKRSVAEGAALADSLRQHPKAFSELYTNMVAAGESSGNLDVVMNRLADFTEKQVRLKSKLIGAITYPVIMLVLASILVMVMMLVVVPKLSEMFDMLGSDLPLITTVLIDVSTFLKDWFFVLTGLLGGAIFWWSKWRKSETGKPKWDQMVLKMPIFGKLVRLVAIARFASTLSTLLASSVPILSAMTIVKSLITNSVLADVIDDAREAVKEGAPIAEPLRRSGQFPPMVTHMIAIGEKSGELEEMLQNVAETYELQVETKVEQLTSLLQPLIIVMMGLVVGFLVFAVVTPMLSMNEALAGRQ